jgi:hypothetical protein
MYTQVKLTAGSHLACYICDPKKHHCLDTFPVPLRFYSSLNFLFAGRNSCCACNCMSACRHQFGLTLRSHLFCPHLAIKAWLVCVACVARNELNLTAPNSRMSTSVALQTQQLKKLSLVSVPQFGFIWVR